MAQSRNGTRTREKQESPQERLQREAIENLVQAGGGSTGEDDILFEGKRVVLPATMGNLKEAIRFLQQRERDEEQDYTYERKFKFRPMDGAHAVGRALRQAFGIAAGKPIKTMFGPIPPAFIDVEISLGKSVQCPWNAMQIPGLDGLTIYIGETRDRVLGPLFHLSAQGPRKHRHAVEGFFNLVEHYLVTASIYRGQAIDGQVTPQFLDLTGVDPAKVIYTEEVFEQLQANVWSPIRHSDVLQAMGQPGKRAVLFEGPYGTGKSLAAGLTAQIAVEHDWTFFMVRPGRDDLEQVLQTARMYQPAVVFFEDLDTVATPNSGDTDHMSKVLDLFDGIESKGLRMLLVLTTNKVEDIHPGMLRPGRLDAVISVNGLDRPGVEKLAQALLGEKLAKNVDFDQVFLANRDFTPAYVVEGIHRTARYAVARTGGTPGRGSIGTEELVQAAEGLRAQFQLMLDASSDPSPDGLDTTLKGIVSTEVRQLLEKAQIVDHEQELSASVEFKAV